VLSLSISQPTKQSFTKITYSPISTNSHTSIPNTINSTSAKETRQPQTTPKQLKFTRDPTLLLQQAAMENTSISLYENPP
ncbi:13970_t:CDS:2, partial [Ambispora leptoticha]